MSPSSEITFEVQIKQLQNLPRSVLRSPAKRKWYITLQVGTSLNKTNIETRGTDGSVVWDREFTIAIPAGDASSANLALYRAHSYSNDEKVAEARQLNLIEISGAKDFTVDLFDVHSEKTIYGGLVIQSRVQLPKAELALARTGGELFTGQLCKMSLVPEPWQYFLSAFQQATEVARQFSELNPTVNAAVGAVSFALMAVVKQIERDQRVCDLREMMASLLLFFRDVEALRKSPFLCNVLDRTLCQVSECTYFILQYEEIESFVQRTAIHLTSDTDGVLDRFFTVFANLKCELALGTSLQTAINTDFILNKVNEIDTFLHINRLEHLKHASWQTDKQCPSLIRDFTINRIHRWISSFEQGLFVLAGPPESGKSAILHAVAGALDKRRRLGAGIFLSELMEGEKTANMVMRSIVYYLGLSCPCVGAKIASELSQHPSLDYADAKRYGGLLEVICRNLVLYGPLVVIVDGLHELATAHDQKLVETILTEIATTSHNRLRFIISSRATYQWASVCWEIDISQAVPTHDVDLVDETTSLPKTMQNVPHASPHAEFAHLSDPISVAGYDPQELLPLLHKHSLGSAEWASLVKEFLNAAPQAARSFLEELLSVMSSPRDEDEAIQRALDTRSRSLPLSVLDHDFLYVPMGSKAFVSGEAESPNKLLHQFGILQAKPNSRIHATQEYDIIVPQSLRELSSSTRTPLLPISDAPLNIYQICLRNASEDGQGPVYVRIALPVGEPLVDGDNIKHKFRQYGLENGRFLKIATHSPPEGCEWVIIHQKLFTSERKDRDTSVIATTPMVTQAILERLVCLWVDWGPHAKEGICMRLRNGKEEKFLSRYAFTRANYHETHSELSGMGEDIGDLRPGDQLQVKAEYANYWGAKYAVIGMGLKY